MITIEDYFGSFSTLRIPDKIELVYSLYTIYDEVVWKKSQADLSAREPFHQFYFWGEMLLRDFDEADK